MKNPNEFMMVEANDAGLISDINSRFYSFRYMKCTRDEKEFLENIEKNLDSKKINYIKHDASIPLSEKVIIVHIVNNIGLWGAGFTKALTKAYPKSKLDYLEYLSIKIPKTYASRSVQNLVLGRSLLTKPLKNKDIYIANLFGQNGVRTSFNRKPIDYIALDSALRDLHLQLTNPPAGYDFSDYTIQAPLLGVGLAFGEWSIIEKIIKRTLMSLEPNLEITVCEI